MVQRLEATMGDDAMRRATGKGYDEWRSLLIDAGAKEWPHARIARWLVDAHGVDGWWAQGITVDFEQVHQGRLPGQRADGTFATSATRTIPGERLDALQSVRDAVTAARGEPSGENLAASLPVVRWRFDDGTRMTAQAGAPKASGTPVTLTLERLAAHDDIEPAKQTLRALLEAAS